MRLKSLILWDMKFQIKYGFYLLYGILTALYLILLSAMPQPWQNHAAAVLIFSDPAAMGLFFMGAIVLLEKSQRVPFALAVSPVTAAEYVIAKVISLCAIALVAAAVLAGAARVENLLYTLAGTALAGMMFTLIGIIIAAKITSLNQFILWMVPVEAVGLVPALVHLFWRYPAVLRLWPASICMDMIAGNKTAPMEVLLVFISIAGLFALACQCVLKMWKCDGGVKL